MEEEGGEGCVGCEALRGSGVSFPSLLDVLLIWSWVLDRVLKDNRWHRGCSGRRRGASPASHNREEGFRNDQDLARLTLSPHTLSKSPGIPSWVFSPCETHPQVQLCSVSLPGARALRTRGRVAAGRARQAERRLVPAATRRAVLDDTTKTYRD